MLKNPRLRSIVAAIGIGLASTVATFTHQEQIDTWMDRSSERVTLVLAAAISQVKGKFEHQEVTSSPVTAAGLPSKPDSSIKPVESSNSLLPVLSIQAVTEEAFPPNLVSSLQIEPPRELDLVPIMPTPIPGAPLSSISSSHSDSHKSAKETEQSFIPKQVKARPKRLIDDSAENPIPVQTASPAEPAIAQELAAAVEAARSRLEPGTKSRQTSKPTTGVFVDLPKRSGTGNAPVPAVPVAPPATATAKVEDKAFSVVSTFEGGLLVKTGRQVKPIRIGEALPNGKKLVGVDVSSGDFSAE